MIDTDISAIESLQAFILETRVLMSRLEAQKVPPVHQDKHAKRLHACRTEYEALLRELDAAICVRAPRRRHLARPERKPVDFP